MMPYKFTFGWVSGREGYTLTEITPERPGRRGEIRPSHTPVNMRILPLA